MSIDPIDCNLGGEARAGQELEWSTLSSFASAASEIRGGVRVELPAAMYGEVADLVERELACCGSWLNLRLTRQGSEIVLIATSTTEEGAATIRNMVALVND